MNFSRKEREEGAEFGRPDLISRKGRREDAEPDNIHNISIQECIEDAGTQTLQRFASTFALFACNYLELQNLSILTWNGI